MNRRAFLSGLGCLLVAANIGMPSSMAKMGRPSLYTPAIAMEICQWIADGKSLLTFCRQDGTPARSVIHSWLLKEPDFAEKYHLAQSLRADVYFDETIDISDNAGDTIAEINKAKLRVDTRKWACTCMAPKKYGNRVLSEHSGVDGTPIEHSIKVRFVSAKGE